MDQLMNCLGQTHLLGLVSHPCWIFSYFLRTRLSNIVHVLQIVFFFRPATSAFVLLLSRFLRSFNDTLHAVLRYVMFPSSSCFWNNCIGAKVLFYAR